ncbi:MAG: DPP IV N-terminal domain-containing protein, partial [Mucilaginibacter sp.]|nr:DPP IV N-terminal domain-containing protein [Mucilaginibacter sp.]
MTYNLEPLTERTGIRPTWLPDDRYYYRTSAADGNQFILVNPAKGSKGVAFDHAKLAAALSATAGKEYKATDLPFQTISYSTNGKGVIFTADGKQYKFENNAVTPDTSTVKAVALTGARGRRGGGFGAGNFNEVASPDKTKAAFIKDFNLFVRDVKSGKETQLTTDGVKDDGYATDNAGWAQGTRPILIWSPDSKKIATFQQDERKVSDMYLVP